MDVCVDGCVSVYVWMDGVWMDGVWMDGVWMDACVDGCVYG